MDLQTLYRKVIMDNYKNPKNKGLLKTDKYHFVHLNNPSCGDDMNVELKVENGVLLNLQQVALPLKLQRAQRHKRR